MFSSLNHLCMSIALNFFRYKFWLDKPYLQIFFFQILPLFCVILTSLVCQRVQKSFKFQKDRDARKQEYPKVGKAVCYIPQSPSALI